MRCSERIVNFYKFIFSFSGEPRLAELHFGGRGVPCGVPVVDVVRTVLHLHDHHGHHQVLRPQHGHRGTQGAGEDEGRWCVRV